MSTDKGWVETALSYASCSWYLIPMHVEEAPGKCSCGNLSCNRIGRHSRFANWREECSRDERDILSWGDLWEQSNLGLVVGSESGVVVLEVDLAQGGDKDLYSLKLEHGGLPLTLQYGVAKEVLYYMFRHPGGFVSRETQITNGLKLLGDDAIVPVPRLRWFDPGESLRWFEHPDDVELNNAPEWLLERCGIRVPRAYRASVTSAPVDDPVDALPFRPATALYTEKFVKPSWLIEPWLSEGALTLVVGSPKVAGKTTWVLNLTRRVLEAAGSPVVYLTEQSSNSFHHTLRGAGFSELKNLRHLHVLYASQVSGVRWSALVGGCISRCKQSGARMLVIDSLDRFANLETSLDCMADSEYIVPLQEATDQGIAVAVVYQQLRIKESLCASIHRLGKLASAADIVVSLRRTPEGRPTVRHIETLSRFEETPESILVDYVNGCYRDIANPVPLFDDEVRKKTHGDGYVEIPSALVIN